MKLLLCLVLCCAAAQAGFLRAGLTYASPYTTFSAGVAPVSSLYNAPLAYSAYSGYAAPYSAGVVAAPSVYSTGSLGLGGHLVGSAYAAPTVYSGPSVYTTLLKK